MDELSVIKASVMNAMISTIDKDLDRMFQKYPLTAEENDILLERVTYTNKFNQVRQLLFVIHACLDLNEAKKYKETFDAELADLLSFRETFKPKYMAAIISNVKRS